jgi:hypothetical protein
MYALEIYMYFSSEVLEVLKECFLYPSSIWSLCTPTPYVKVKSKGGVWLQGRNLRMQGRGVCDHAIHNAGAIHKRNVPMRKTRFKFARNLETKL